MNTKRKLQAIRWGVLALLPLLFGLFTIYAILKVEERNQDILSVLDQGERTTGTIISQKYIPSVHDDEPDTYVVKYTFSRPSGQEVIGYFDFDDAVPSGWNVGDQQVIAYDRQNPNVNVPVSAGYEDKSGEFWFLAILTALMFGGLTFFFGYKAWETW